jgi:hypothetical protein
MKEKLVRECAGDGCHIDISHKGNRATRCDDHQKAFHASQERSRYDRVKNAVSTRRILRRQGLPEYEGPHEDTVIDYRTPDQAPKFLNIARGHPNHDAVTRARLKREKQEAEEESGADQADWSDLQAVRAHHGMTTTSFPAPGMDMPGVDPIGRSVPRSRGLYDRDEDHRELVNPAADGSLYVRSPASGQRALHQAQSGGGSAHWWTFPSCRRATS